MDGADNSKQSASVPSDESLATHNLTEHIKYSVVIGAVNEANIIEASLNTLKDWLVENKYYEDTEVVVITAEGKDNTPELVNESIKQFKHHNHIKPGLRVGKGRDIQLGMHVAQGDYMMYMDADLATPLRHLKTMFNKLETGDDVVIGIRDLSSMHNSFSREFTSLLSNTAIKILIWQNISDTQCGFKGFSKKAAKEIFDKQTVQGWAFDSEILVLAKRMGYKVVQFKVDEWEDPKPTGAGLVGDSQLKAMISSLKEVLNVRKNVILRKYGPKN